MHLECMQARELTKEVKSTFMIVCAAEVPKSRGRPGKDLIITMEGCEGLIQQVWDGSHAGLSTAAMTAVYADLHNRSGLDK